MQVPPTNPFAKQTNAPAPKAKKVEAKLGNLHFVLKECNRMGKDGTLPIDGKIYLLDPKLVNKAFDRVDRLLGRPDCTNFGYIKQTTKAALKALGIEGKIKKQMIKQIAATHGGKAAWGIAAVMYSQNELLNKGIKDAIRQVLPASIAKSFAKMGFGFEVLKDASNVFEGVREAYYDHDRHCKIYNASVEMTKQASNHLIGTIEFSTDPTGESFVRGKKPAAQEIPNRSKNNPQQKKNASQHKQPPKSAQKPELRKGNHQMNPNDAGPVKGARQSSQRVVDDQEEKLEINIDEITEQFINIAGDLLGVKPAYQQAKDLKNMFVNIFANPGNAPKHIVDQLIKEPEKIFKQVIDSPDEFIKNGEAFLKDPNLMNAANVVGTVYSMVSLANEILPMVTKLGRIAAKNPGKAVLKIPEELGKLTVQKIIGVYKLGEALFHNPGKAIINLGKGLIKQPEQLVKNIRNLFGHDKRKRKRRAKKLAAMQAEMERRIQAENERIRQENERILERVIQLFPLCYSQASKNWMKSETMKQEAYFQAMLKDWQNSNSKGIFVGDFVQFLLEIHKKLQKGYFSQVYHLSPKAHLKEPVAPSHIAIAFAIVVKKNLVEACDGITIERLSNNIGLNSKQTYINIRQLSQNNTALLQSITARSQTNAARSQTNTAFSQTKTELSKTHAALPQAITALSQANNDLSTTITALSLTSSKMANLRQGKNAEQLAEEWERGLSDPDKLEAAKRILLSKSNKKK